MDSKFKNILERAVLVGVSLLLALYLADLLRLSKFYVGIAVLNVANLNGAKTRRQAYERTITTFCGGAIACMIAYSGFQENMFLYLLGLIIVCCFTEMIFKVPATVGCIAFTYIMLNIDPNRTPSNYLEERVLGTALGATMVALLISLYSKYLHKNNNKLEKYPQKEWKDHFKRAAIPGIAVILGVFLIDILNNHIDSRYVTKYTMYYCALASVVPFHIDLKELLKKTKERFLSTIFGGVIAFIFSLFGLNGNIWSSIGIVFVIVFIECVIGISGALGGVVFLFLMFNVTENLPPLVYYLDRVIGTGIGIVLILTVVCLLKEGDVLIKKFKKW